MHFMQDIRHFSRRGFAFVQFHSVEEAVRAINGFEKNSHSRVDGIKVQANFAKEHQEPIREGRPFMLAERSFLQKQAIATAEALNAFGMRSTEAQMNPGILKLLISFNCIYFVSVCFLASACLVLLSCPHGMRRAHVVRSKGAHTAQEIAVIEKEIEDTDSDDGWSPKFTIHDKQISRGTDRLTTVEELDTEPADVFFHVDMYDSVLVAAFGGVTMNLDGSDELHVHPGILFIFCVPLVLLQFWLTFCTTFGMPDYWRSLDPRAEESMIISIKLLLIVVVQLTFFDNMLMTLRCLMFAINPTTWTDVKRIDPEDQRTDRSRLNVLHWSPFLAPFPIMALLTKVMMQYWVSVQSMSIIMASDNVKEAVFDALAISFIVELDVAMWNLVRTIMHLDSFENFTFQLWPMSRRARALLSSPVARLVDIEVLHRGKGMPSTVWGRLNGG
eukprot:s4460_g1.t1